MEKSLKVFISKGCLEFDKQINQLFKKNEIAISFIPRNNLKTMEFIDLYQPDIVVIDTLHDYASIIELLKLSSRNKNVKKPEFIVISDTTNPDFKNEIITLGVTYFMISPINPSDLASNIIKLRSKEKLFRNKENALNKISESNLPQKSVEIQVTEILHQIGVPAHIKGYHYLRTAIMISIETPEIINAVTKQLYPSVAKEFSTTSSRVERAIRHAIEVAWDRGDMDILNSYFGYTIHTSRGKPTNSEFIAMISDKLRLRLKSAS